MKKGYLCSRCILSNFPFCTTSLCSRLLLCLCNFILLLRVKYKFCVYLVCYDETDIHCWHILYCCLYIRCQRIVFLGLNNTKTCCMFKYFIVIYYFMLCYIIFISLEREFTSCLPLRYFIYFTMGRDTHLYVM